MTGRTPSSRFDSANALVSTTPSPARTRSFGPCGLSQRRLAALATKAGEISGLSLSPVHRVEYGKRSASCSPPNRGGMPEDGRPGEVARIREPPDSGEMAGGAEADESAAAGGGRPPSTPPIRGEARGSRRLTFPSMHHGPAGVRQAVASSVGGRSAAAGMSGRTLPARPGRVAESRAERAGNPRPPRGRDRRRIAAKPAREADRAVTGRPVGAWLATRPQFRYFASRRRNLRGPKSPRLGAWPGRG